MSGRRFGLGVVARLWNFISFFARSFWCFLVLRFVRVSAVGQRGSCVMFLLVVRWSNAVTAVSARMKCLIPGANVRSK